MSLRSVTFVGECPLCPSLLCPIGSMWLWTVGPIGQVSAEVDGPRRFSPISRTFPHPTTDPKMLFYDLKNQVGRRGVSAYHLVFSKQIIADSTRWLLCGSHQPKYPPKPNRPLFLNNRPLFPVRPIGPVFWLMASRDVRCFLPSAYQIKPSRRPYTIPLVILTHVSFFSVSHRML